MSAASTWRTLLHVNGRTPGGLLVYWGPPVFWAVMLLVLSSRAFATGAPSWLLGRDKLPHAAYFGVMALLVYRALRRGHRWPALRAAAAAFLLACLYGAADELLQRYQPTRNADVADWAADTVGASVVFLAPLLRLPPRPP